MLDRNETMETMVATAKLGSVPASILAQARGNEMKLAASAFSRNKYSIGGMRINPVKRMLESYASTPSPVH